MESAASLSHKATILISDLTKSGYYELVKAAENYDTNVEGVQQWHLTLTLSVKPRADFAGWSTTQYYYREHCPARHIDQQYEEIDTGELPCGCIDVCRCRFYDW